MARLSKKVATGPVGLLSTYDAGSVTEALNSLFYFILIDLKSHLFNSYHTGQHCC